MTTTITKKKRNRIPLGIKVGYKKLQKGIEKIYYEDLNYNILNRITYAT